MANSKHSFQPLPIDDEEEHVYTKERLSHTDSSTASRRRLIIQRIALWLSIFVVATLALIVSVQASTPQRWKTCGNSKTTALERGCSFDLISFAWQTPECYDRELVADFTNWRGNWSFYADEDLSIPVTQEVAMLGEQRLFVPWDYHIVHCTFMWRQMHRAYERGWIDSHLGNYNHTLHCQQMILTKPKDAAEPVTVANLMYPECLKTQH